MQAFQTGEIPHGFAFTETGGLIHYKYTIVLAVPMANQSGWSGDGYISFGSDWADVRLRVAIHDGQTWATVKTINITAGGIRVGDQLPASSQKISIGRVKTGPNDTVDNAPASWLLQYQTT
ncbi:hypothetical protein NE236_05885 [Actinoallomurus purpureus]|uniref:hypothetical protein n=1 Tax=Actinoallomurus purpureus TaxID=478114 RepID=UPI002092CF27|nr:hypothetical protein [Actinoallomurus purpureus]MCO6004506.1 hypothetical protein [Actinoallomurus purpureus]